MKLAYRNYFIIFLSVLIALTVTGIFKKEIAQAEDPVAATQAKVDEYREKFSNPYIAAERGYIDDIIEPAATRPKLIAALEMLANKVDKNPRKKHGNIPL